MQVVFLFLLLLVVTPFLEAQDTLRVKASLKNATVYFGYGAELTHEGKLMLGGGSRIVLVDGVSTSVDPNSLQVSLPEGVALLSQQFRIYQAPIPPSKYLKQMEVLLDSNRALQKEIARYQNLIATDQEVLVKTGLLIESPLRDKSDRPILSADILRMLDVYTARIEKARFSIFQSQTTIERLQKRMQDNQQQINKWNEDRGEVVGPVGQLILQVSTNNPAEHPLRISYYTPHAGWGAQYDVRVNSKDNKIKLVYKASLTQSTGFAWKQVMLTLSTGTPNFGVQAPVLTPWYLQLYVPELYNQMRTRSANVNRNVLESMTKEKSLADVVIMDIDQYRVAQTGVEPSDMGEFTTLTQGQLNTQYEISLPYDVPADGQVQQVNIQERTISAGLKNYAVPKLDREAYLMAEVSDWQNLDLIPGLANIIMDDTYIGRSHIDPNSTADTLNLPLGRDKRIAIRRTKVREAAPVKSGAGMTKQTFTYEVTIKNNKVTPVELLLKDQHPLSSIKEVEVQLEDAGGADVNPETGVLTWKLELKPGEIRKLRFVYSVRHPKDKRLVNL